MKTNAWGLLARLAVPIWFLGLMSGCATMDAEDNTDPLVTPNRGFYEFNDGIDKAILEPVANAYIDYVPRTVRSGVTNFYDNLGYVNVIANDFLQGKVKQGFDDIGRFTVNSTVTPLFLTPSSSDLWTGAAPRYNGSRLGWMLSVPWTGMLRKDVGR